MSWNNRKQMYIFCHQMQFFFASQFAIERQNWTTVSMFDRSKEKSFCDQWPQKSTFSPKREAHHHSIDTLIYEILCGRMKNESIHSLSSLAIVSIQNDHIESSISSMCVCVCARTRVCVSLPVAKRKVYEHRNTTSSQTDGTPSSSTSLPTAADD